MSRNPINDFIQFIVGGSLFGGGIFLLANQVMASSVFTYRGGGWGRFGGSGSMLPIGTPGIGMLMIPLGIGVCLLFAGTYKRWAEGRLCLTRFDHPFRQPWALEDLSASEIQIFINFE
jgi:hypothetical protein